MANNWQKATREGDGIFERCWECGILVEGDLEKTFGSSLGRRDVGLVTGVGGERGVGGEGEG